MASASSIALSLDGWTSQNSLPMLAINAHWMSSAFQQNRACIEVEITGSHSGENLANIVATALERFHISLLSSSEPPNKAGILLNAPPTFVLWSRFPSHQCSGLVVFRPIVGYLGYQGRY
jgi:hypothetical protein